MAEKPIVEDYQDADKVRGKSTTGHNSYNERFVSEEETSSRANKTNNWRRVKATFLAAIYIATGAMAYKGIEAVKDYKEGNDTLNAYVQAFEENYIENNRTPTFTNDGVYYQIETIANELKNKELSQADYYAMYTTMGEHATNQVLSQLPNAQYKTIEEDLTSNGFYNDINAWHKNVSRSLVIEDELSSMFKGDKAKNIQTEEKDLGGK